MHRDHVRIFRGNVETHIQRLDELSRATGASIPTTFATEAPPPKSATWLHYGSGRGPRPIWQTIKKTLALVSDSLGLVLLVGSLLILAAIVTSDASLQAFYVLLGVVVTFAALAALLVYRRGSSHR